MRLLSPVPGTVLALSAVPDAVFAQAMVGPGVAIDPLRSSVQQVLAPADGVVAALHPHAFALQLAGERGVLVHLGIDTVRLAGLGFDLRVTAGQTVRAGEVLLTWSPVDVAAGGLSVVCPVVALQADPDAVRQLVASGSAIGAGEPLLDWDD